MNLKKIRNVLFIIGFSFLLMLVFGNVSVNADENMVTSSGNNVIAGESYFIQIGYGENDPTTYLTGDEFKSENTQEGISYFQISRPDGKTGVPIVTGDPFIIRCDNSGKFWNWHSNMIEAYVYLGDSAIPYSYNYPVMEGSEFSVCNKNSNNNGYNLRVSDVYALGYDYNNTLSTNSDYYHTKFYFYG